MRDYFERVARLFGPYLPSLLGAIAILLIGWVVALVVSNLARKALRRTNLGARMSRFIGGEAGPPSAAAEKWIGNGVFYLILIFVLVAFFQALGLTIASNPLGLFLTQVFGYATRLLGALVLLLVAWIVASALRFIVTRALTAGMASERLGALFATTPQEGGYSIAQTVGEVVYWLIFLLFLPAILGALGLEGILVPVQGMLNKLLNALPNIFAAALLLIISWLFARILQRLVANLLAGAGFNDILARLGFGAQGAGASQRPSEIAGYLVLVAVMLFSAIEASRLLGFELLADMITQFTVFIGRVVLGLVIFALGLFLANLVYRVVMASDVAQARLLAMAARVSILFLAGAMALRQIGVA
ncbi:MAG TPA: mechanosensitive ion channel, partial [Pyrinomonadaceae bacterium]